MPYLEIKTRKQIDSTLARKIVDKGSVSAVLTTGLITRPAKALFDQHGIAYAENTLIELLAALNGWILRFWRMPDAGHLILFASA
ncbi:hypothetical protein [Thermoleptolyngbya sp.]